MVEPKILLIIPAYNESEGIAQVIQKVDQYRQKSDYRIDYIVINDGSTDNEEEILIRNEINHIELIQNLGIGGAVQTGYKYALERGYDVADRQRWAAAVFGSYLSGRARRLAYNWHTNYFYTSSNQVMI